jgi:ribokinase
MRSHQSDAGVDTRHVIEAPGASGRAVIEVDADGDNSIIVVAGANHELTAEHVVPALDDVQPDVVLTQLESPRSVTSAAAAWTRRHGRRFVLNPSPVAPVDPEILQVANPLVVNEAEAEFYCDKAGLADPEDIARHLITRAESVVITLGSRGVVVATVDSVQTIEVEKVRAVDTTGAGDHFAGSLAWYLAAGADLPTAARRSAGRATAYVAAPR